MFGLIQLNLEEEEAALLRRPIADGVRGANPSPSLFLKPPLLALTLAYPRPVFSRPPRQPENHPTPFDLESRAWGLGTGLVVMVALLPSLLFFS